MQVTQVTIIKVGETVAKSEKFQNREMIVVDDPAVTYPNYLNFEVSQDKVTLFDALNPGDVIDIDFHLNGRLWTDPKTGNERAFNTLKAYKIVVTAKAPALAHDEVWLVDPNDLPF